MCTLTHSQPSPLIITTSVCVGDCAAIDLKVAATARVSIVILLATASYSCVLVPLCVGDSLHFHFLSSSFSYSSPASTTLWVFPRNGCDPSHNASITTCWVSNCYHNKSLVTSLSPYASGSTHCAPPDFRSRTLRLGLRDVGRQRQFALCLLDQYRPVQLTNSDPLNRPISANFCQLKCLGNPALVRSVVGWSCTPRGKILVHHTTVCMASRTVT